MRRFLTFSLTLAASLAVASCNKPPLSQQAACNCPGAPAASGGQTSMTPPDGSYRHSGSHYRGHHRLRGSYAYDDSDYGDSYRAHGRYRGSHHYDNGEYGDYGYDRRYSQTSVSSYSYRSHSRAYAMDDSDDYGGGSSTVSASAYARAWAGGGSSSYSSGGYTGDAAHYETDDHGGGGGGYSSGYNRAHLGPRALRKRMDPWHGYNRHY